LSEEKKGTIYAILAFTFWGLVPIYFKQVSHVSAFEVLIHRILWSVVFLSIIILFSKSFYKIKLIFQDKQKLKILFVSAILISINWLTFIWAISHNKIVEASLGYFINPLISVFLGYIFFNERISKQQSLAIFISFLAIIYQIYAIGNLPIISLLLAFSFGFYGLARKKLHIESVLGLFIETLLISPFAVAYIIYLIYIGNSSFIIPLDLTSWLLVLAGFVTIIPLLWFNSAAIRISMMKLGFLQYIGPSLAFLLAVFVYNEPFDSDKLITFIMIWFSLIIFSVKFKKLQF